MARIGTWIGMACGTERDRRNQRLINLWGLAWMASWLGASLLIKRDAIMATPAAVVGLALLTTLLGLATLRAYRHFINEADELVRKIELDALATAFGLGLVSALTLHVLATAALLPKAGLAEIVALMMVIYALAVMAGHRRYA